MKKLNLQCNSCGFLNFQIKTLLYFKAIVILSVLWICNVKALAYVLRCMCVSAVYSIYSRYVVYTRFLYCTTYTRRT